MTFWEKSSLLWFILLSGSLPRIIDIDKSGGIISFVVSLVIMASGYVFLASGKKEK